VHCLPGLRKALATSSQPRIREAARHLEAWDGRFEVDRVGAILFEVFFSHWTAAVTREQFEGSTAALLADGVSGLAAALLDKDEAGWFKPGTREEAIVGAMASALDWLSGRLGPDMAGWAWGRLHTLPLRHVLSARGDLGQLLDHGGQ